MRYFEPTPKDVAGARTVTLCCVHGEPHHCFRASAAVCQPPSLCISPPSRSSSGALCDVSDSNGVCPIHVACDRGHADIAQLLCDCGADVNRRTRDSLCPLHLACRYLSILCYFNHSFSHVTQLLSNFLPEAVTWTASKSSSRTPATSKPAHQAAFLLFT